MIQTCSVGGLSTAATRVCHGFRSADRSVPHVKETADGVHSTRGQAKYNGDLLGVFVNKVRPLAPSTARTSACDTVGRYRLSSFLVWGKSVLAITVM